MVLRLDPGIPLVWRDPFSLQFGVEPARVVLRELTSTQERLVAALVVGISPSGLQMVGKSLGADAPAVDALVAQLAPVLVPALVPAREPAINPALDPEPRRTRASPPKGAGRPVEIVGSGPTVDRIATVLAASGHRVAVNAHVVSYAQRGADADAPELAIAVGHYVFDPAIYSHWLRRDIPHLPVIFADGTVTVGPLVEPGVSACLNCIEFYRRDADARWSTLASQLWGRRSAAELPLAVAEASALATRIADRFLRSDSGRAAPGVRLPAASSTSFRIAVDSGLVARAEWLPHPECGCCAIDVSAAPRGIDSALARRRTAFPPPPTKARVADGRA